MLAAPLFLLALSQAPTDPVRRIEVVVHPARHEVVLTAGPFDVGTGGHAAGVADHGHELPLQHFRWPVTGWLRGFRVEVIDGAGRPLPRAFLHHFNLVNFARRQLLYPAAERILAAGQETETVMLPKGVGIPVAAGMPMATILAWHNQTGTVVPGVRLRLILTYSPAELLPRPIAVFPVYFDVVDPVGQDVSFDLPPGPSEYSADFSFPISGRVLGFGGHLHRYGLDVALTDLDAGDAAPLVRLAARQRADGEVASMERRVLWSGEGTPLRRGHRYRLTGRYLNPTDRVIPFGGMVHLIALVAPDRPSGWPAVDQADPDFQRDLARLAARGSDYNGALAQHHH